MKRCLVSFVAAGMLLGSAVSGVSANGDNESDHAFFGQCTAALVQAVPAGPGHGELGQFASQLNPSAGTPQELIAILRYASQAAMNESLASPEGQEAFADVANFATGGVTAFLTSLESVAGTSATATPAS